MSTINCYFLVMVLLKLFKDDVAAAPQNDCSFIKSEHFLLSIRSFDQADFKSDVNVNVNELENKTVDQFLTYLQEAKKLSLSWHNLSILDNSDGSFAPVSVNTPICQVIDVSSEANKVQYTLYVGKQIISAQILKERFMKGIIYDDQSRRFKLAPFSPITLDDRYKPSEVKKGTISLESQIIKLAYDDKSFRNKISTLILSGKHTDLKSSEYNARYAVASLISQKTEILMDKDKIELSQDFRDKLYAAASKQHLSNLERTKEIINILNNYGWYVTNHFDLGGRLDVTKNLAETSDSGIFRYIPFVEPIYLFFRNLFSEPEKETDKSKLEKMESKLGTQWNNLGGNVVINHKDNSKFTGSEYITSTVEGAIDVQSFKHNMEHEQKWTIVSVKNIIPTCKLLFKKDAHLMGEIRRLIVTYGDNYRIRQLQPNINMVQYINELWADYVIPF